MRGFMPVQIKKRDGRTTKFNSDKIYEAINKASQEVSSTPVEESVLRGVVDSIVAKCKEEETVESVQDYVEKALMEAGLYEVAKAYILYRQKRTDAREGKSVLMNKIRAFHTEDEGDPESTAKENANVNAKSVSGSFYRCGSEANKEFNKTDVIPKKFVEAFERGDIYYHEFIVA